MNGSKFSSQALSVSLWLTKITAIWRYHYETEHLSNLVNSLTAINIRINLSFNHFIGKKDEMQRELGASFLLCD